MHQAIRKIFRKLAFITRHISGASRCDNNDYQVRYINGNCWMVQNLRFSGSSINPDTTNISVTKNISWGDLTAGNTYDVARYHNSGNASQGFWYNYAGASAMTITGSSNSSPQQYDICPKNWKLPTVTEFGTITSYPSAFSPVAGGRYDTGAIYNPGQGMYWSATAYNANDRYYLYYYHDGDDRLVAGGYYYSRPRGFFVRCIRSS